MTQMDGHSVDLDPGLNYNAAIPHFKMEKIYIAAVQIVARLQIVNARWYSSFAKKSCPVLTKYESQITQKCFDSPRISVKSLSSVLARFPKWRHY